MDKSQNFVLHNILKTAKYLKHQRQLYHRNDKNTEIMLLVTQKNGDDYDDDGDADMMMVIR